MTPRKGDWIQTFTGRCFWPLDPKPEEVFIEDIAHALSMTCRFAGHCTRFYSVAEHSVNVSRLVPPEDALWGLLHDAAEAYSADIPRPLKRFLTEWKPMEDAITNVIVQKFGLPSEEPRSVKEADWRILADEQSALMSPCEQGWSDMAEPFGIPIFCLAWNEAKFLFLNRFRQIQEARAALAAARGAREGRDG